MDEILNKILFSDVTQREGRQTKGFNINICAARDLILKTNLLGIDFIEMPHPASSKALWNIMKTGNSNIEIAPPTQLSIHVRAQERDILLAIDTGIKNINTYIPIRSKNRNDIIQSIEAVNRVNNKLERKYIENNINLRISFEHTKLLGKENIAEMYWRLYNGNKNYIKRVGFSDTIGSLFPDEIVFLAEKIHQTIPEEIGIQYHLHNDIGMAAANFNALIELGNKYKNPLIFDISIGGLGERNGILSYGDVFSIMLQKFPNSFRERYNLEKYNKLFSFVNSCIKKDVFCPRDPINPGAFCHSAGPHLSEMIKSNSNLYQNINPQLFGMKTDFNVFNSGTGWKGLQFWFKTKYNYIMNENEAKILASQIREEAALNGYVDGDAFVNKWLNNKNNYKY